MDPASDEWTMEAAQACWRPMVRPVQHVGVPGYQFQAAVLWDGSLVFGPLAFRELQVMQTEIAPLGDSLLHLSVGFGDPPRFVDRHGSKSPEISRHLVDGRLPIPVIETRDGPFAWEETVFAHLLGRPPEAGLEPRADEVLVVHARFRVTNTGDRNQRAHLWLYLADTSQVHLGYKCGVGDQLGQAPDHQFRPPLGFLGDKVRYVLPPPSAGEVRQHESARAADGMPGPLTKALEWSVPLGSGEEAALELIVPYGLVGAATARKLAALDTDKLLAGVRRYWKRLESGPGQIVTPDPFVNDYLAAVAGQMAQQVAYRQRTDVWMYKTSPNNYEGYWPCNAAKALPAFDFRGLGTLSRPVMADFIRTQTDDPGSLAAERRAGRGTTVAGEGFERRPGFLGNFGEWTANTLLLSHGLELWDLASHYRITRDDAWLGSGPGSPLQAMLDGCDWLAAQRRRTMRTENGQRVAHWGLLPAASAHDWLSGNAVFNDAFCIYGMTEVVRLLREIGHPRAEELARELADYRACLHDRLVEARDRAQPIPQADGTMLPYVPRDIYELDWRGLDWTYTGYSPLRAGAWGALEPDDELVDQSFAFLENGMPRGEGPYFSAHTANPDTADANWADISDPNAPRHYLWRHYVEYETMWPVGGPLFLARDDLPRFFEWLFNNLAVVLHHDFRVGVESLDGVPSCAPGDGERWQLIRSMFVNERGGYDGSEQALWLCQALPRCWLQPGAHLSVRDMGTRFGGRADLDIRVAKDGAVTVSADLDLKVQPTEVRLRLRSGDGRPLRSATVNGEPAEVLAGDTILLPNTVVGQYKVVGRFG